MDLYDNFDLSVDPQQGAYCVDIAMLIDATGSMAPIIEEVKTNALEFCNKFHETMEASGKNVDELRIKVIPFRDYKYDGANAMDDSGFYSLPEQNEEFHQYVAKIKATGGGDGPESALEAIALAMRSDWTTHGNKQRHVILVFTDAPAAPLGDPERTKNPTYPDNMPADLPTLGDMWEGESQEFPGMPKPDYKRLVLFVPEAEPWSNMQIWNNVWHSYSKAGKGLDNVDIEMAINLLVASMSK